MIGYLKGKNIYRGENFVILNTGSIGYRVYVERALIADDELEFYIYHYIREGVSDLYGFKTPQELEIFELMLSVSGVGPRLAQAIVAGLGKDKIFEAVGRNEPTLFRTIPGVGAKLAAKIVVELKNKVGVEFGEYIMPEDDETVEALTSLGYRKQEIIPYLKNMPSNCKSVQDKVKYILKNVGKKPS